MARPSTRAPCSFALNRAMGINKAKPRMGQLASLCTGEWRYLRERIGRNMQNSYYPRVHSRVFVFSSKRLSVRAVQADACARCF